MKTLYLLLALMISAGANAQIKSVSLQASGLTCSMCSNAIYKALKTLDFIQEVDANIKTYTFVITFKDGSAADFEKMKKKVEGAGFSVAGFIATIQFNNANVDPDQPLTVGPNKVILVNAKEQQLNGEMQVKILDKGFVTPKEHKKYSLAVSDNGNFHGSI